MSELSAIGTEEIVNVEVKDEDSSVEIKMEDPDYILNVEIDSSDMDTNYNHLSNKPKINGITLMGDKEDTELNLQRKMNAASVQEIETILYLGGIITNG